MLAHEFIRGNGERNEKVSPGGTTENCFEIWRLFGICDLFFGIYLGFDICDLEFL